MCKFAVVSMKNTNEVSGIKLKKYLAGQMEIIEECDAEHLKDKVDYWKRIYNYKKPSPEEDNRLSNHFYNPKTNKHLYSEDSDEKKLRLNIKDFKDYKKVV